MKTDREIEGEDRLWQTELDLKKSLIKVHDEEFRTILGEDFKLAKLNDQERAFILDMVGIGRMALDLVPNPDIAQEIKDMDFLPIKTIAILRFNIEKNMIVDRSVGWGEEKEKQEDQNEETEKWINRLQKRLGNQKKEED